MATKSLYVVVFDKYAVDRLTRNCCVDLIERDGRVIVFNSEYEVDVTDLAHLRSLGYSMSDIEMEINGVLHGQRGNLPPQVVGRIIATKLEARAPGTWHECEFALAPTDHDLDRKELDRAIEAVQSAMCRLRYGPRAHAETGSHVSAAFFSLRKAREEWNDQCRWFEETNGLRQPRERVRRDRPANCEGR